MNNPAKSLILSAAVWAMTSAPSLADATVTVDDTPVNLAFSGFVRADFGAGDRYPTADGEERFGSSKNLLLLSATTEDVEAILDFGGTIFNDTNFNGNDNGSVGIKDAFIVVGGNKNTGFTFSVGAQPLLFGLHPNGYPGDSSLQANIDYGAAGGFAVSQQAGPSIIGNYRFSPDETLRFGAFDLAESNAVNVTTATNGSTIKDNLFLIWRGNNIAGTGLYASAGGERIYVGVAGGPTGNVGGPVVDGSKTIYSAGVGFKNELLDASVEYIHLDADIVNTATDERYIRAHVAVTPVPGWTGYADFSNGHELGVSTYRIGGRWQFRRHLAFTAEYSSDIHSSNAVYNGTSNEGLGGAMPAYPYGTMRAPNVNSVDLRATFTF
jgi:hypothetical protein